MLLMSFHRANFQLLKGPFWFGAVQNFFVWFGFFSLLTIFFKTFFFPACTETHTKKWCS